MSTSPLSILKKSHGSKDELIAKLLPLLERAEGENGDEHKERLKHVANAKLLHLLQVGTRVKELGGRAAIITKILALKGQPKDREFQDRLGKLPLARLLDQVTSLERGARAAAAKKAAAAKRAAPAKAAKKPARAAAKKS